jgi:hydrogenase maturation protease
VKTLVIGIGNPLAGDDGAGQAVAHGLDGMPDVTVRICHQLTPELAVDVASADRVVFVDAAQEGALTVRRVRADRPVPAGSPLTHAMGPETVVAMAQRLYGRRPRAYLVTVPGASFRLGAGLSASVHRLIPSAVAAVKRLLRPAPPAATRPPLRTP